MALKSFSAEISQYSVIKKHQERFVIYFTLYISACKLPNVQTV